MDSTNDELRRRAEDGAGEGSVVIAEAQSAGRGRMGRSWHSPPGVGLYVSILVRDVGPEAHVTRWTLAAAVAACEACRSAAGLPATIKWPNDLEFDGRKLAGILAELRPSSGLVLGLGVNVGHRAGDFPEDLAKRATSLALAGRPDVDREALVAAYLDRFAVHARQLSDGAWDAVREAWLRLAPDARGRRVEVRRADGVFAATTRGIDSSGGLRVEDDGGRIEVVRLADAVRAIGTEREA